MGKVIKSAGVWNTCSEKLHLQMRSRIRRRKKTRNKCTDGIANEEDDRRRERERERERRNYHTHRHRYYDSEPLYPVFKSMCVCAARKKSLSIFNFQQQTILSLFPCDGCVNSPRPSSMKQQQQQNIVAFD